MQNTSNAVNPLWKRPIVVIIAAILCLVIAGIAWMFSRHVDPNQFHNQPNAENLEELSEAEILEAQEELEQSLTLVPKSAVMVSHVNVKAMKPEVLEQWWDEWFYPLLPPGTTSVETLEGLEGLNSITYASYYPTERSGEQNIDFPLLYSVVFNIDTEYANENRELLIHRNSDADSLVTFAPGMGGFLDENGVPVDSDERTQVIAITDTLGISFIESLNAGEGEYLEANTDWFTVNTEPILYMNVTQYLDSYMKVTEEKFAEANATFKETALGITSDHDFIWVGESFDYGQTWEERSDLEVNQQNSNDPSLINGEKFSETAYSTIGTALLDPEGNPIDPTTAEEDGVTAEMGIVDVGLMSMIETMSVKGVSEKSPAGAAYDPYIYDNPVIAEPVGVSPQGQEVPVDEEIIVVLNPTSLANTYRGGTSPLYLQTLTFRFFPDDSSTLEFLFRSQEQMEEDDRAAEEAAKEAEELANQEAEDAAAAEEEEVIIGEN